MVDVHLVVVANAELVQEVLDRFRLDVRNGDLVPVVLHPDVGAELKQRSDCPCCKSLNVFLDELKYKNNYILKYRDTYKMKSYF